LFIRIIERIFLSVLFLFLMGVVTVLLYGDNNTDSLLALQGSLHLPIVIIQLSLSAIAVCLISMRWRRVVSASIRAWPLLILAGIQILSIAWSINPGLSARRVLLELVMLFIGIYLGERYSTDTLARLLARILCQTMVLIAILYVVAPRFVLDADQHNALKGLSQNKNGFGFYIGLTVALLLVIRFRRFDWLRYLFLPAAIAMLLLSRSMTSVGSAFLILATLPLWLVVRLSARQRAANYTVLGIGVATCGSLFALFLSQILALVGKDTTLTGRTEVWKQLVVAIGHRPLLGYGYGAFWTGLSGESLDVFINAGWFAPSAHNAYLELWLGLGIPGLCIVAIIFWYAFRMAVEYIRTEPGWAGLWPVACILFILVHGGGESEFIYDSSFACCLFTALYTSLALRTVRERRSPARNRFQNQGALSTEFVAG